MSEISRDWVLVGIILLTGSLCFGLGLIVARENQKPTDSLWIEQLPKEELPGAVSNSTPVSINTGISPQPAAAASAILPHPNQYVASKSGTKYYLPTCGSAKRIKDENKIWFASKAQAEAAGYTAASTCKGL